MLRDEHDYFQVAFSNILHLTAKFRNAATGCGERRVIRFCGSLSLDAQNYSIEGNCTRFFAFSGVVFPIIWLTFRALKRIMDDRFLPPL